MYFGTIITDFILRKVRYVINLFTTLIGITFYPSHDGFLPPIDNELLLQPATRLAELIKKGELKSEDLVRAYIERCKLINKDLNAIVHENFDGALQQARMIDKRIECELRGEKWTDDDDNKTIHDYPLLGVPYTAKNSISIKGFTISCGTYFRKGMIAKNDCQTITNMKNSGAIFLALTNVPDTTLFCDSFNYLDGQTNNPYDKSCIPGGSSGGEASLISSAGSIFGIGSDIAGSLRIPAHFCGIYSHCTTTGNIIIDEMFPKPSNVYPKVLTIGPMCRYACDLRPMLKVITNNKLDLNETPFNYKDLNVYYVRDLGDSFATPVEDYILNGMDRMLKHFSSNGSRTMEMNMRADDPESFYDFRYALLFWIASMYDPKMPCFLDVMSDGKSMNPLIELFRCLFGIQKRYAAGPILFAIVRNCGEKFLTQNTFDKYNKTKEKLHRLLDKNTVILSPITPETAPKHNQSILKSHDFIYTMLWSAMDVAITTIPMGLNSRGMPFAIQVIAGPNNDKLSISIAEELAKHNVGGWIPPCKVTITSKNP